MNNLCARITLILPLTSATACVLAGADDSAEPANWKTQCTSLCAGLDTCGFLPAPVGADRDACISRCQRTSEAQLLELGLFSREGDTVRLRSEELLAKIATQRGILEKGDASNRSWQRSQPCSPTGDPLLRSYCNGLADSSISLASADWLGTGMLSVSVVEVPTAPPGGEEPMEAPSVLACDSVVSVQVVGRSVGRTFQAPVACSGAFASLMLEDIAVGQVSPSVRVVRQEDEGLTCKEYSSELGYVCVDGNLSEPVELELAGSCEVSCADGLDDDENGLTDCEDPSCTELCGQCIGTSGAPGEDRCDDPLCEPFCNTNQLGEDTSPQENQ